MKIAVVMPSFGRLDCLEQCLLSLSKCQQVESGQADVLIFPDAVSDGEDRHVRDIARKIHGGIIVFPKSSERLYGCRNQIRAIRTAFHLWKYTHVIRIDSDMRVSKHFLTVLCNCSAWMGGGVVISRITCELDLPSKIKHAHLIDRYCQSGSNIIWPAEVWEKVEPLYEEYERLFMSNRGHVNNNEAKNWLAEIALRSRPNLWNAGTIEAFINGKGGTVGDSLTHCLLGWADVPYGSLVVNRLIHISDTGENMYPEYFQKYHASTTLDEIDQDAERTEFEWA